MITKENFCKMAMAVALMLPSIILLIVWFATGGKVVEATMFEEIAKWVLMDASLTGFIAAPFGYILAPFFYHWIYDKKKDEENSKLD